MPDFNIFADKEAEALVEEIFAEFDKFFSEAGQRRRFMMTCNALSPNDLTILQSALCRSTSSKELVEMAQRAERPLKMAYATLMLNNMLSKTRDSNIFTFLHLMLSKPNVIRGLNRIWFGFWEKALLKNRNLSAELIRLIWSNQKNLYYKEAASEVIRLIAGKSECPSDVLEDMLTYDDAACRSKIALHKNITSHVANYFINSKRKPERLAISMSQHLSKDMLLSLCHDKYTEIADSAKKNLKSRFGEEVISEAEGDGAIALHVVKSHSTTKKKQEPFDAKAVEFAGIEAVLSCKDSKHRKSIAETTANPAILRELAKDASAVVRRSVASNKYCSSDILEALLGDEDVIVSRNSLDTCLKRHPGKRAETILPGSRITAAKEQINFFINKKVKWLDSEKKRSLQEEAEIDLVFMLVRTTADEILQLRIAGKLKEMPDWDSMLRKLLSELSRNQHLADSVTRKLALELGFATEIILEKCQSPSLLKEFLSMPGQPAGVRGRIEQHYKKLVAQEKD